jgi:hypothetical protein
LKFGKKIFMKVVIEWKIFWKNLKMNNLERKFMFFYF